MKRVKVLKDGIQTHGAEFDDPAAWVAEHIAANSWGRPERWVDERELDLLGEDKTKAVEVVEEIDPLTNEPVKKYKFAAEYTIEITDITAEITAKESAKAQRKALIEKVKNYKAADVNTAAKAGAVLLELIEAVGLKD